MNAKDIKVGHIYYVDFEPVRKGEFDKYHMALVLKKTLNQITFISIPLTSNADGNGKNKVRIDITSKLPTNLQGKSTYAVYDQLRTLNASRFHNLMENGNVMDVEVDHETVQAVIEKVIKNLLDGLEPNSINAIIDACKPVEKKDQ